MLHRIIDRHLGRGGFCGPWEVHVPAALAYANAGINGLHANSGVYEAYMVAHSSCTVLVNGQRIQLAAGELLLVEPGEENTFIERSPDYLHYVVSVPWVRGDKQLAKNR